MSPPFAALALTFVACVAAAQAPAEQAVRMRAMPDSALVHKVQPVYPVAALRNRLQGLVVFQALIGKDGRIEDLRLASGHPSLVDAAGAAVRQWVYRPTLVKGEPVRVLTEIEVRFALDRDGRPVWDEAPPRPGAAPL